LSISCVRRSQKRRKKVRKFSWLYMVYAKQQM
jgi:hypothetical protein